MKTTMSPRRLPPAVLFFLAGILVATPARAGLRFTPISAPEGADTSALAADGATLWAGTIRGVWKLQSGAWSFDGLPDRTVSSIAVSGGTVWTATGDGLWNRGADGTWSPEALPGDSSILNALATDGSVLYAAGIGVFRNAGGSWTALPPAGGIVSSLATFNGDLVAGIVGHGAVRYSGGTGVPVAMSAGFGFSEGAQAFATFGGVLYAGTQRGVYSWNGVAWTADAGYGVHNVRALASASGSLWAASIDGGVSRKNGATWTAADDGLLSASSRSFALLGSDLYVGTAGAPVYRYSGTSWSAVGTGLAASIVSDVSVVWDPDHAVQLTAACTHGAGAALVSPAPASAYSLPSGCGDVRALAGVAPGEYLAATTCGPYLLLRGYPPIPVGTGLDTGAVPTSLSSFPGDLTIVAGTSNAGIWRFWPQDMGLPPTVVGGSWSADDDGLPSTASISAVRQVGDDLFAAPGIGVARRGTDGTWVAESTGLPDGSLVQAFGGPGAPSGPVFVGLTPGGIYRRDPESTIWRSDTAGLGNGSVYSIDLSGSRLFAAAGPAGLLRKVAGAWLPENAGLPSGVDVRVVRYGGSAGSGVDRLLAGTAGNGLFGASAVSSVKTIPVVLDVPGAEGGGFHTELTLGNRDTTSLDVTLTFSAAPDFGAPAAGSAVVTIPPGSEVRAADALAYLRGLGMPIPSAGPGAPVAGSLTMRAGSSTDFLYGAVRSFTIGPSGGTYGVFLDAVSDLDAAEDEAALYGLRSAAGVARSNLAVTCLPGRDSDPVTLEVQIYDEAGEAAPTLLTETLAPGDWYQWNNVLEKAGLPDGSFGYARIRRVSGVGAWIAYGVVNDAVTSDGSILPMFRPGGLSAARKLIVPIVVDTFGDAGARFTTELTLVNDGPIATPVDLVYRPAPGFGSAPGVPLVTLSLAARQQTTIPDVIQYLRDNGVAIPDPATGGPQAGTLSVTFRSLQYLVSPQTVALARTSTPGTSGGTYGVFYAAAAAGGGSWTPAVVPGLVQSAAARTNLAVVHTGGGSSGPISLSVALFDATTGLPVGTTLSTTLNPGDWYQWSRVLEKAGVPSGTTAAWAVVTRISGDDTFLAYAVVNDAVTSDGSWVAMIPGAEW